jgi:ribosomal protein L12E/L44/L45/RPP1/RPP2
MKVMKKLLTLLFAAVLAVSLSMPVFAQDSGQTEAAPKAEKHTKKMHKAKKAKAEKKAKKEKKEKKGEEPPPAQ